MKPLEQIQQIRNQGRGLKEKLKSVRTEESDVEERESEASSEIIQARKIIRQLENVDWQKHSEEIQESELQAVNDLEKASENLQIVCSEINEISREISRDLEGEETIIERASRIFQGVKSGEYNISGPGVEKFADTLHEMAEEVKITEKELEKAVSEVESAEKELKQLQNMLENPSNSSKNLAEILRSSGLESETERVNDIRRTVENSLEKCRESEENFEVLKNEFEQETGVDSESRRGFLRAASSVSATALMGFSGCMGTDLDIQRPEIPEVLSTDRENPWNTDTLVVEIVSGGQLIENFPSMVENAVNFWNRNDERYLGYPVTLSLRENASNPHIRINVEQQIDSCGDVENAGLVGCSPLVRNGKSSPASIRIEAGHSRSVTDTTLKHELGHVLGLDHADNPQEIMSDDPSVRIENFGTKSEIASLFNEGMRLHNSGIDHYRDGLDYYQNENYSDAEDEFRSASQNFQSSSQRLQQAENLANEAGESDAVQVIERGRLNAEYMSDANRYMVSHIEAYYNGNQQRMENMFSNYRDSFSNAQSVDAPSGEELAVALDL